MNTRQTGSRYEQKAARWLEEKGVKIICANFRCRYGEIDLVAHDGDYLVFVEVKYRKDAAAGHPAEAVTATKQRVICKVAAFYCLSRNIAADTPIRYDVVAICGDEVIWYQNAFDHVGPQW